MAKAKILYVEDHQGNIYVMENRLKRWGYEAVVAMDGQSALAMARTHKPDLILMDIQLPGIDGLEATRRIKADPETKDIPVIAVSAFAMYDDRDKALAAGCDGYFSKPVDFHDLRVRIQGMLDKKSGA
jgi:CheY-like chemotaxis protein